MEIYNNLKYKIAQILEPHVSIDRDAILEVLTYIPISEKGQISFPCFLLAKQMKMNPFSCAQELVAKLVASSYSEIEKIETKGPYINFHFTSAALGILICEPIIVGSTFAMDGVLNVGKTMIEYSQPNTHKLVHVGHFRNMALGRSLVHLHEYFGVQTISSTFPGDVGAHIGKSLWFYEYHSDKQVPAVNKGEWLGNLYSKAIQKYNAEVETEIGSKNRQQLSAIMSEIEAEDGYFYDLWKETRKWSIDSMNDIYKWASIEFDKWYWESDVDRDSVKTVKKYFDQGVFAKSNGAIGIDLEEFDLGFCVLITKDDHGLYAAKDLELSRVKFEDYDIEKSIYIVDQRQEHHFKQIFKICELIGFENAKNCVHLKYNYVELPEGAMSSREGNVVSLDSLINQMEHIVKKQYKGKLNWRDEEIEQTARKIVQGTMTYGMLKVDPDKKIVFNIDKWLDIKGNSGIYLQYTLARIKSILAKENFKESSLTQWGLIESVSEEDIIVHLSKYNEAVHKSFKFYKPNVLCNYLYDLCKFANQYYAEVNIRNSEAKVKETRLRLYSSIEKVLENGFSLIGIPILERI